MSLFARPTPKLPDNLIGIINFMWMCVALGDSNSDSDPWIYNSKMLIDQSRGRYSSKYEADKVLGLVNCYY